MNYFLGGSIWSIISLGKELKKEGNEIFLACPKKSEWKDIEKKSGFSIIELNAYPWVKSKKYKKDFLFRFKYSIKKIINWFSNFKIKRVILKNKIDIVHINTLNFQIGISAYKLNVPVVWHIREFLEEDHGTEFINFSYSKKQIEKAKALICISRSVLDKYSKLLNCKSFLVYNGIDSTHFFFNRKSINSSFDYCIIGRIEESKGQLEAVKAFLKSDAFLFGQSNLNIVGSGDFEYCKIISSLASSSKGRVKFLGRSLDVEPVYMKCFVNLVCSKNEAFGRTTVEAMMNGCLVIASNTAGSAEIISDKKTGLLYEEGDESSLIKAMNYVFHNLEICYSISKNGQAHSIEHYSLEKYIDGVKKVYKYCL